MKAAGHFGRLADAEHLPEELRFQEESYIQHGFWQRDIHRVAFREKIETSPQEEVVRGWP